MGPEVLNSIWEAVVKQILKDVVGPTNFVGRFLELNGVVVNMTVVFHPEVQEFAQSSFGVVGIAEDGAELAGECGPIVDPRVSGLHFDVPAEMTLRCTIEVLNGIIDFLWICWERARLGCEHQAALKKEIGELGVIHARKRSGAFGITLLRLRRGGNVDGSGWRRRRRRGRLECLEQQK